MSKIIVVTGGREWDNAQVVYESLTVHGDHDTTLIHGDCRGLDKQAGKIAALLGMTVDPMPAEWRKHIGYPDLTTECRCNAWRKAHSYCSFAGPRRNRQMLDKGPDVVLAYHPNLAESRGTKDCVDEALRRGIPVFMHDGHSVWRIGDTTDA